MRSNHNVEQRSYRVTLANRLLSDSGRVISMLRNVNIASLRPGRIYCWKFLPPLDLDGGLVRT
jgi:hypothetical protein